MPKNLLSIKSFLTTSILFVAILTFAIFGNFFTPSIVNAAPPITGNSAADWTDYQDSEF